MVSNIKFYSFKEINISISLTYSLLSLVFFLLSFLIHLFKASAIFAVIALYIVYSINFILFCVFNRR